MPIMLTRKDGPPTPFRNAEYIPFYYFIPKSILSRCGAELNAIPRNPQELFHNRAACEFVESDLFRLLITDATAFMVWPYMGFGEYMEIYSGYDPAWRFAHCPDYWIQELTDEGILASAGELFKGCHSALGYVPEWQIAASISDKLSLVISLSILDVLVPCLDIKARGFQVFLTIPNADSDTLQFFDSLGSFRHCKVIGFR